ncbi:MAG: cytochrome d ubiquinol oxidase subunit II [Opitutaceae bacterium]|nr:cytochrome d ubiquinol oxidase subunit II [Opitutaceae bacterium]
MTDILIFFIGASLLLYILLGGADFGAGILELLPSGQWRERQKVVVNRAMGPVWEANHLWLILIVVILFMGFPRIFTTLMISLHVPLLALLVGIVLRGTVFTFRHYDAIQDARTQRIYTRIFGWSSLWTALWLGIIAASLNRGIIDPAATGIWAAYFAPWWGWYPLAVGVFVACIFGFLAAVYLTDETDDVELQHHFRGKAAALNLAVVLAGGLVFLAAAGEQTPLHNRFLGTPLAMMALVTATLLFVALWFFVSRQLVLLTRVVAAGQVTLILLGWYVLYAPNALITAGGPLSFYEMAAPDATLRQLVIALLVGSLFIFPSLIYLLWVFKTGEPRTGAKRG